MNRFSFNEVCAIAHTIDGMCGEDTSICVDGELDLDGVAVPLEDGEATRMVVERVLGHPIVQERIASIDAMWETILWLTNDDGSGEPDEKVAQWIDAAVRVSNFRDS